MENTAPLSPLLINHVFLGSPRGLFAVITVRSVNTWMHGFEPSKNLHLNDASKEVGQLRDRLGVIANYGHLYVGKRLLREEEPLLYPKLVF